MRTFSLGWPPPEAVHLGIADQLVPGARVGQPGDGPLLKLNVLRRHPQEIKAGELTAHGTVALSPY